MAGGDTNRKVKNKILKQMLTDQRRFFRGTKSAIKQAKKLRNKK